VLDQASSILLTLALTVSIVNAMNFVDGLDGLAAGLGLITASAICIFSVGLLHDHGGDVLFYPPAVISVVLAGACLGFLPHNFHRAKIFMGDSGSMLVGLMLAAAAVTASLGLDPQATGGLTGSLPLALPLLIPAAVLALPLVDLVLAVLRRVRRRQSPFSPDKEHLHHRLLEIGHTHRRAVLLLYFWSALLAFGGVAFSITRSTTSVLVTLGGLAVVGVIASMVPRVRLARR